MIKLLIILSFGCALVTSFSFKNYPKSTRVSRLHAMYDITVIEQNGEEKTVTIPGDDTILKGLDDAGIDAPFSCQTGLCTECASLVESGMENIELEAAILDPKVTEQGFVLTCSAHLTGPGVRMRLGVGDEFYEAQYGELVENHRKANPMR